MPNCRVKIGNWQEQQIFEADQRKLLSETRAQGGTLSQQILAKVTRHRQAADLQCRREDGFLRYGEPIMMQNAETCGFLSVDTDDRQHAASVGQLKITPTTAVADMPMLRNSFVLLPVQSQNDMLCTVEDPSVIHYGQRFMVRTADDLFDRAFFMGSTQKSPTALSKITANQEAFFATNQSQNNIWMVMHANREYREDMVGQPVRANAIAMIVHSMTHVPLASTKARYGNDFGLECEVCCNRYLEMQAKGGKANENGSNLWALVTAPSRSAISPEATIGMTSADAAAAIEAAIGAAEEVEPKE